MRLSDLQHKDVVNIIDGKKIGNIIDITVDLKGNMEGLIIEKSKLFCRICVQGLEGHKFIRR